MTNKEIIQKLGLKDYIIYNSIRIIEIIINIPYKILKYIIAVFYIIFDNLDDLFIKDNFITISKISKKADNFRKKCIKKVRE